MRNIVGLLGAGAFVAGALLAYLRLVRPIVGFALFALGGLVCLVIGVASIVQLVRGRGVGAGGAVAVLAGVVFMAIASRGAGHPRINDFTTDLVQPPAFVFATRLPGNEGRDLGYPAAFAAIQRECCADLRPAKVAAPPDRAFERAVGVAEHMPAWRVTSADAAARTVEAVVTSKLFGFQDDVVIRVQPEPDGSSRVDVRSKSRDGQGDMGVNAARIRQYVEQLEAAR